MGQMLAARLCADVGPAGQPCPEMFQTRSRCFPAYPSRRGLGRALKQHGHSLVCDRSRCVPTPSVALSVPGSLSITYSRPVQSRSTANLDCGRPPYTCPRKLPICVSRSRLPSVQDERIVAGAQSLQPGRFDRPSQPRQAKDCTGPRVTLTRQLQTRSKLSFLSPSPDAL